MHYARWLSIHHYDMEMVKETNPEIRKEFDDNENLTVKRTQNQFSKMAIDQCHEHLNKDVKGILKVFKFSLFFNINGQLSKLFLYEIKPCLISRKVQNICV